MTGSEACLDAIFGSKSFVNQIIWHYASGGRAKTYFPQKHDVILWYAKTHKKRVFNKSSVGVPRNVCEKCGVTLKKWNNLKKHVDDDGRIYRTIKSSGKVYKYYDDEPALPTDVWLGINHLHQRDPERIGWPTQKPLKLYGRIVLASSNKGDFVLDPFAGCATTCVAAERLGRQWAGIDIWEKAHEVVIERIRREGLATPDGDSAGMLAFGDIHYTTDLPERTDEGDEAAPFLRVKERIREPAGKKMSRAEMYEFLLSQYGQKCQGCERLFDDPRYLQLDHNTPRSDGGLNHITNRVLLCGPCNRAKSNIYTLTGLRRRNKRNGWMAP